MTISIKGKTVTPRPGQIDLGVGESITITVTSDHDDELHAHGFEVDRELKAGVPTRVILRGSQPGRYEIETHHPPLRLLQVDVR